MSINDSEFLVLVAAAVHQFWILPFGSSWNHRTWQSSKTKRTVLSETLGRFYRAGCVCITAHHDSLVFRLAILAAAWSAQHVTEMNSVLDCARSRSTYSKKDASQRYNWQSSRAELSQPVLLQPETEIWSLSPSEVGTSYYHHLSIDGKGGFELWTSQNLIRKSCRISNKIYIVI